VRIRTTAVIVALALVAVVAISVTGQEEALPAVTPKTTVGEIPLAAPSIVLAVEPIRDFRNPTLVEAARHNDYVTFDALYTAAKKRGEDVSQFATLHDLWTYSVTDPIGAFYGRDLYERLNRAYPGYAAYIADYRIVDNRGNAFYPTSETRAFLLDRVIEGRTPRVVIASKSPRVEQASAPATRRRSTTTVARAQTTVPPSAVVKPPVARQQPAATAPVSVPVSTPVSTSAPTVSTPVSEAASSSVTTPVPAATRPILTEPAPRPVEAAPAPAVAAPVTTVPAAATQPDRPLGGRGLLLLFIGLIGIGLLAVILRTPREEPMKIVQEPPANNVEPLRKPQAAPKPPSPDTPRATGSHG
jgi:hypothetical protein